MPKTLFIAFEGADGTGKNTQTGLLYDQIRANGLGCLRTSEPDYRSAPGIALNDMLHSKAEMIVGWNPPNREFGITVPPTLLAIGDRYSDKASASRP